MAKPAPDDPTPALARAAGCSVTFDPGTGDWLAEWCGGETVVALTDRLATYDARTSPLAWRVRSIADALRGDDAAATARAVHDFVAGAVRYRRDDIQRLRTSASTLDRGEGNCVSKSRLLLALARAAGLGARAVPVVDDTGEVVHMAPQLLVGGEWTWADGTLAARLGETPYEASERLRVTREDLRR